MTNRRKTPKYKAISSEWDKNGQLRRQLITHSEDWAREDDSSLKGQIDEAQRGLDKIKTRQPERRDLIEQVQSLLEDLSKPII